MWVYILSDAFWYISVPSPGAKWNKLLWNASVCQTGISCNVRATVYDDLCDDSCPYSQNVSLLFYAFTVDYQKLIKMVAHSYYLR